MSKNIFDFEKDKQNTKTIYGNQRKGIEDDYTDNFGIEMAKVYDGKATTIEVISLCIKSLLGYNNV